MVLSSIPLLKNETRSLIIYKMGAENWNVSDEQVLIKTGKKIADWCRILDRSSAADKKPNDVVAFLQTDHGVNRHWARILTTNYLLNHDDSGVK